MIDQDIFCRAVFESLNGRRGEERTGTSPMFFL